MKLTRKYDKSNRPRKLTKMTFVRFKPDHSAKLQAIADKNGTSRSGLIRTGTDLITKLQEIADKTQATLKQVIREASQQRDSWFTRRQPVKIYSKRGEDE